MSRRRAIEVGDIVAFREAVRLERVRPWGAFTVEGRAGRRTLLLRCWSGLRLRAHWRSLRTLMPVEARVADLLMRCP